MQGLASCVLPMPSYLLDVASPSMAKETTLLSSRQEDEALLSKDVREPDDPSGCEEAAAGVVAGSGGTEGKGSSTVRREVVRSMELLADHVRIFLYLYTQISV